MMTNEQKRIIAECLETIKEAELQVYMADGSERQLLDSVSHELSIVHKKLESIMKAEQRPANVRPKHIARLLNEGIL